jgi:ABC-type transport system substrate-binding protein
MVNFDGSSSREELLQMVEDVLKEDDPNALQQDWAAIHRYYHAQAFLYPLYGKRIPTLLNKRLDGYQAGLQQFDYPVHKLVPVTGSTTVTIAPGARTGLFDTVGTMNAHVYGPNEFFSNNWVYDGLVALGANGQIIGTLATDWTIQPNDIGGDTYTFTLRESVKFHDGADWNCEVAKLNFDHIFAGALKETQHGWYGVGRFTDNWLCNDAGQFIVNTNTKHAPYMQELALIRPVRMISPNAFVVTDPSTNGTDALDANSCHLDWGTIDKTEFNEEVNCAGIQSIAGTGPFKFDSKEIADGADTRVIFTAHEDYWGGVSAVKRLEVVRYVSDIAVRDALLNGELDVVWGAGVLSDEIIFEIQNDSDLRRKIDVFHSDDVQNVIIILNTGKPPLDDINVRKTIIHSINKAAIVQNELKGLQQVVDNVFPLQAPYCDIQLSPRWDYDLEKAVLLSCGGDISTELEVLAQAEEENKALALGLGLGLGSLALIILIIAGILYRKNKNLEEKLQLVSKEGAVDA